MDYQPSILILDSLSLYFMDDRRSPPSTASAPPASERLGVGQLADWVLASRAQGGAPPYTPLDATQHVALRDALPKVEAGRIDAQLAQCLVDIDTAKKNYVDAHKEKAAQAGL